MRKAPPVSASMLRDIISYNPDTGEMIWKTRTPESFSSSPKKSAEAKCSTFNKKYAGQQAFSHRAKHGYFQGSICNKPVYAHRAAWAIHHGEWPSGVIDHINGDGFDNRIENLRQTTQEINMRNRIQKKKCSDDVVGVQQAPSGRWTAKISIRPKHITLGTFDTKEEATIARKAAEKVYGFTGRVK